MNDVVELVAWALLADPDEVAQATEYLRYSVAGEDGLIEYEDRGTVVE